MFEGDSFLLLPLHASRMALDSSSTRAAPTASTSYIAASCNRASNVADCRLEDGLVAFGSGHFVALWNSSVSSSFVQTGWSRVADGASRRMRTLEESTRRSQATRAT